MNNEEHKVKGTDAVGGYDGGNERKEPTVAENIRTAAATLVITAGILGLAWFATSRNASGRNMAEYQAAGRSVWTQQMAAEHGLLPEETLEAVRLAGERKRETGDWRGPAGCAAENGG